MQKIYKKLTKYCYLARTNLKLVLFAHCLVNTVKKTSDRFYRSFLRFSFSKKQYNTKDGVFSATAFLYLSITRLGYLP